MQLVYLLITKNNLFFYEKKGHKYEPLYIEGNPGFPYDRSKLSSAVHDFTKKLSDEFNLSTVAELEFVVIGNEDETLSKSLCDEMGEYCKERRSVTEILKAVYSKYQTDKKLHIAEFGLNFDGINYKYSQKGLEPVKSKFDLLGYALSENRFIEFVK